MTAIHANVLSAERFRDQYRLIIQLVPSEFLGPFERLRFKKNPYCGSFGSTIELPGDSCTLPSPATLALTEIL